jgi:hypothetical protein
MCLRRRKESIFLTYRGGNGSREAHDREVPWSVLDDGEGGPRWSSGSSDGSDGGGDDGRPFSKQQLCTGGLGSASPWCELGGQWRLVFGWQRHQGKLLFVGVKPRHVAHYLMNWIYLQIIACINDSVWILDRDGTNSVCFDSIPNRWSLGEQRHIHRSTTWRSTGRGRAQQRGCE